MSLGIYSFEFTRGALSALLYFKISDEDVLTSLTNTKILPCQPPKSREGSVAIRVTLSGGRATAPHLERGGMDLSPHTDLLYCSRGQVCNLAS